MHKERLIRIALKFNFLLKELFDVMPKDIADAFDEQPPEGESSCGCC